MLSSLMPLAKGVGSSLETDGGSANAIEKALSILVVLVRHDRPLGTVQISRITGFHKATTSRILSTLERFGLVVQNDRSRKYVVGHFGMQLGQTQLNVAMQKVARLAQPRLDRLVDQCGAPALLHFWVGKQSILIASAEMASHQRALPKLGEARALPLTAGGRAILSCLDGDRVRKLVAPAVEPVSDDMLKMAAQLSTELAAIRATGIAHGQAGALATALLDQQAMPMGAVTLLSDPDDRTDACARENALWLTARRLSADIGQAAISGLEAWHYDGE